MDFNEILFIIDDPNLRAIWLKQGHRFSRRVTFEEKHVLNRANILTIRNLQPTDLGVYKCKAIARQPLRHRFRIVGEAVYNLTIKKNII